MSWNHPFWIKHAAMARHGDVCTAPPTGSWAAEADLDKWLEAKRARDYKVADAIRDNLRSQGIDACAFILTLKISVLAAAGGSRG